MRKQQVLNIVNSNNGTEAQNKTFKCEYLPLSIYGISVMLVDRYVSECHQRYQKRNVQVSSPDRVYNTTIPSYLHNRLAHFIKHCLKAKFSSGDLRGCDVQCADMAKGVFSKPTISDKIVDTFTFSAPYTVTMIPFCPPDLSVQPPSSLNNVVPQLP